MEREGGGRREGGEGEGGGREREDRKRGMEGERGTDKKFPMTNE